MTIEQDIKKQARIVQAMLEERDRLLRDRERPQENPCWSLTDGRATERVPHSLDFYFLVAALAGAKNKKRREKITRLIKESGRKP